MKKRMMGPAVITLTVGLFGMALTRTAAGEPMQAGKCYECHRGMVAGNMSKRSVHQPFLQEQCAACHVDGGEARDADGIKDTGTAVRRTPSSSTPIQWINQSARPAAVQWFVLPAADLDSAFYIESRDGGLKGVRRTLTVPPLEEVPVIKDDKTPPTITNVRVLEVRKGVLIAATIGWHTDEIADSAVAFGSGDRNYSGYVSQLTRDHEVILMGLKADQSYRFTVLSQDIFGNRTESGTFTLTTAQAKVDQRNRSGLMYTGAANPEYESEIYRSKGNYVVKVSASRPAVMAIGIPRTMRPRNGAAAAPAMERRQAGILAHGGMEIKVDRTVSICLGCHKNHKGASSHPVDVHPKRGMIVPADYPLSPAGKITCLTCHTAHASNLKNMLRKSDKRELCIGCHRDKKDVAPGGGFYVNIKNANAGRS